MPHQPVNRDSQRYRFGRDRRLGGRKQFAAVFAGRAVRHAGLISVHALPNGTDRTRLGLSVPRRVGLAVKRNRIKRLLREAFRLRQHDLPAGYDVVIVVRPHDTATLACYQQLLATALSELDSIWQRRQRRSEGA